MPKQDILLTAFPRALSIGTNTLPVSVFVSPRLTGSRTFLPDERTLSAFPDWLNWTQLLKDNGFKITLDVNGHAIEATIDTKPLRPDLWAELFSAETLVDTYEFPDYSDRTVISFSARAAMFAVKALYQQAAKDLGLPADPRDNNNNEEENRNSRRANILTSLLKGFQLDEWSDNHRLSLRSIFGQRIIRSPIPPPATPTREGFTPLPKLPIIGADGLPSAAYLRDKKTEDVQSFREQVTAEFALYSRMPPGAPIVKPDMAVVLDFHKVISALNAYPVLLRALGLVFDLDLPASGVPLTAGESFGRLIVSQAEPGWREFAIETDLRPAGATAVQYQKKEDGNTYWFTTPRSGSIEMGLLKLEPGAFGLAQFDVDGAMHKLTMLAAGVPTSGSKLSPALHPTKFDEANTVPALRSVGISLIQDARAGALLDSIAASKHFNDRLNGDVVDDIPFFAEDLVRGYRLDVWNSFDNTWRSLHHRKGRYEFGDVVFTADEEGFTQLAAMQPAPDPAHPTTNNDLYLHEAVARWGGWSLSVPPPGKAISRSADPKKAVPPDDAKDRSPDDRQNEPVTPFKLKTTFNVTPRSLPSLRFGRRYRVRLRVVDLAGNSLAPDDPLATESSRHFAIPRDEAGFAYLRYEPVPAPQIVRRDDLAITGPGSALDRLVIRTFNKDPSLDDHAADLSGSDRHIVPPRTSIEIAERHGMLDDLSGRLKGDAATYRMLMERDDENGSQFPSSAVPGQTTSLPIVTAAEISQLPYVPDPLARCAALRDLPGAPEHACGTATRESLTYELLKDPNPRVGSVTMVHFDNEPDWLKTRGFRLALDEGNKPPVWDTAQRLLTVFLPKGSTTIVPLSSAPTSDDLKLLGIWQWLREYIADLSGAEIIQFSQDGGQEEIATLLQYVIEGGHWMLTPPTLLTLVSAVQQPLGQPRFEALAVQRTTPTATSLRPIALRNRLRFVGGKRYDTTSEQMETISAWRSVGALDAYLIGALRVHGQSTDKVDLFAEWEEWIDDPLRPGDPPIREARSGFVDTLPLHDPSEDRVLVSAGERGSARAVGIYNAQQDLIGFTTYGDVFGRDPALGSEGDATPRHYLGDTKHRRITYMAVATSRYRDYFPQDQNLNFTRTSSPVEVNVPASARPPLVSVRYVLPTFGWERQSSTNLVRSVRYGGGMRVYLERPWYESGEGELLGVVLWEAGSNTTDAAREAWKLFVTQWGRDPIWRTSPGLHPMPGPEDFSLSIAAETNLHLGEIVPTGTDGKPAFVSVAGHAVAFDVQRKLWYCDIALDTRSYSPFVRLALARYQPNAIAEAKLSRVVLTDFIQLAPDRSALVSADPYRPKELRMSVTGTAPDGPPPVAPGELPGRPTDIRIRVQHRAKPEHGEFGWHDVDDDVALVQVEKTDENIPGVLLWQGRVIFANPPASDVFRLLIEEREYISADHVATSVVNGAKADQRNHAPGRIIYAEIVSLDDALTVVPARQATAAALPEESSASNIGGGAPDELKIAKRIIVQLREDMEIPYADGAENVIGALIGPSWNALLAEFPFLSLDRLFQAVEPKDLDTLFPRAATDLNTPYPALQKFFTAVCPPEIDPEVVVAALRAFSPVFERVYVEAPYALPGVKFENNPLATEQFYLNPAPDGFDMKFAWTQPGGDGATIAVADIESDWDLDHEDLKAAAIERVVTDFGIPLGSDKDAEHGTMSLGIIVAADNTVGGVGLAPATKAFAVSVFQVIPGPTIELTTNVANAVILASAKLSKGDVLFLEVATDKSFPMETEPHTLSAIIAAVSKGITVIEPGGNGPGNGILGRFYDFDTLVVPATGRRTLNPNVGIDSGAVVVSACSTGEEPKEAVRGPKIWAPRGERINCFAYGDNVFAPTNVSGPLEIQIELGGPMAPNPHAGERYTSAFNGTSSASALIAGAAVSLQGIAKSILSRPLSPFELRQILSDRTLNTPSANPASDRIGVMPDLRKITDFLKTMKTRGSVISGTWATVRTGHELVHLGNRRVLDWVPAARTFNVWPYDSMAISGDPLPSPAIKSGVWSTIQTGHTLIYMGSDVVLDFVPATGAYRLFTAEWDKSDFLPGPAKTKGVFVTIRDQVVGGVPQQHRLVYLGGDHVLDWVPQDRSFRIWNLDRRGTRQDPFLGVPVAQAGGTVREQPLAEGVFPDSDINVDTQIITIDTNQLLIFHADTGKWKVLFYDRILLSPTPFTDSPRSGTWKTIRLGHVLLWLGQLGNGQLLDWEPTTGRYRVFPDIPLID